MLWRRNDEGLWTESGSGWESREQVVILKRVGSQVTLAEKVTFVLRPAGGEAISYLDTWEKGVLCRGSSQSKMSWLIAGHF